MVGLCLLMLTLGVTAVVTLAPADDAALLTTAGIVPLPAPRALPDVSLTTASGHPFTPAFFQGKWTLVLFGAAWALGLF